MRCLKFLMIFVVFFLVITEQSFATEYVAFSLKVAKERVVKTSEKELASEVFNLGGITKVVGLVYDQKTGDVIIVGEMDPGRATLTLDDFAVALRARFIHGKWPLVSIDPTEKTEKTKMQVVRFEGGIEDTQLGEDLFDADYRLKQIGMGFLESGVPGLKTDWDLEMERARESTKSYKIRSRFWFYPVLPSVQVREDVVAIKGLKIGVFTEVLSAEIDGKRIENLSTFQDPLGDRFASGVSENFEGLAKAHPSFLRLQGLDELVALTKAIEEMDEKPDLSFWLKDYKVRQVKTKKEVAVLRRKEEYDLSVEGGVYKGYLEVSGGVELMAIALRLNAGDVTALKEAALKMRTSQDALWWSFIVAGEWLIHTPPGGMLEEKDIVALFPHVEFLYGQKRYDEVLNLVGRILDLKPDCVWAQDVRGVVYIQKERYDDAVSCYDRVLELVPNSALAYFKRGLARDLKKTQRDFILVKDLTDKGFDLTDKRFASMTDSEKREYDLAISDYSRALTVNPHFHEAYFNRAGIYASIGRYTLAIADYNSALEIDPSSIGFFLRGNVYFDMGNYDNAISDYGKVISEYGHEIDLTFAEAYRKRGIIHLYRKEYEAAYQDLKRAMELDLLEDRTFETLEKFLFSP